MSNKINIYKIKESIGFSLGFDNVQKIGNISQLDKFSNIIYEGEIAGSAESSHKKLKVYKVHFLYGDDKIQELIVDFLENDEQAYKKDNLVDIVTYIQNVFKNQILSQIVAELLGDLGEGLFISTLEKNKIDWCDAYHVEENSLFDFYFDGVYIDVKATTENKKQIIVQQDQLPTDRQNVTICVAQIPKKQGGKNIINLLMSIKTDNQLIKQKIKKWNVRYASYKSLIDSYTVTDETKLFFMEQHQLPVVNFIRKGNMTKSYYYISTVNNTADHITPAQYKILKNNKKK